jgi:hypothetical protein
MEVSVAPVLFNTERAAKYCGKHPRTMKAFRLGGYGPKFLLIGKRVYYRQSDLDEFLAECVIDPKAAAISRNRKRRHDHKAAA